MQWRAPVDKLKQEHRRSNFVGAIEGRGSMRVPRRPGWGGGKALRGQTQGGTECHPVLLGGGGDLADGNESTPYQSSFN